MPKKWIISPAAPADFLNSHPELPPIIARLLWNRNLREQKQIDEFLNPDYSQDIHDPFLFKDMDAAVDIIFKAIDKEQKIVVHGDYDADGVCSAALLVNCLKNIGASDVGVFIPHREIDGYGLNLNTVELLQKQGTDLIITCDCGISNFEEVKAAKKAGMKIIITDHHTVPAKLPPANAIIHPLVKGEKYPDKGLCGAAVAFKLTQALLKKHAGLKKKLADGQTHEAYERWSLDLAAIATVGDMVPLLGESRTLTRYGLIVLNKTRNVGLKKLFIASGMADADGVSKRGSFDSSALAFQLVPRLNAAGRMDHANTAFALLVTKEEKEAAELAAQLNKNNSDRQRLTEQYMLEARKQIKESGQEKNPVIFVLGEDWPTGILGLISGKIKDEFYKPAIVMNAAGGQINGSGRSIREFNLIASLQTMPKCFYKFGGHPAACGFTLKEPAMLEEFKKKLTAKCAADTAGVELVPQIIVDGEISVDDVNWKLYDLLQKFEPFGQANEEPRYAAEGLTISNVEPVGQDGKHLRLTVKHNSHVCHRMIGFGLGDTNRHPDDWRANLRVGDKVDLVFSIGVNEWNGRRDLEMKIEDIKKSLF